MRRRLKEFSNLEVEIRRSPKRGKPMRLFKFLLKWPQVTGCAFGIVCMILVFSIDKPQSALIQWTSIDALPWRSEAPNFSFQSETGDLIDLNALRGTNVGLVFVSSRCAFSQNLKQLLMDQHSSDQIAKRLVFINDFDERELPEETQKLDDSFRARFTVVQDTTGETFQAYGVRSVPHIYWIDELGKIKDSAAGLPATLRLIRYCVEMP